MLHRTFKEKNTLDFRHFTYRASENINGISHQLHNVIFILKGELILSMNEYKDKVFVAGQIAYIPRLSDSSGVASADSEVLIHYYEYYYEPSDIKFVESLSPDLYNIDYQFEPLEIKPVLKQYVDLIVTYLRTIPAGRFCEIKQREMFILFKHYYTRFEIVKFFYPIISVDIQFKQTVIEHYSKVKTVEELAAAMGLGLRTFHRIFQKNFGVTPYQWIQQQTARKIEMRLRDERVPLKEIMADFNFSTASHFNVYCKRHFGASPSQIRERMIGARKSVSDCRELVNE